MCGQYSRRRDKQRIAEAFQAGNVDGLVYEEEQVDDWSSAPSYNVAPKTMQPVVRSSHETGRRALSNFK